MTDHTDETTPDPPSGMADKQYRSARRKKRPPFNFELDPERREQLHQVAQLRGISKGATLRQLISTAFLMDVQSRPHCASGRDCFMPHLHPHYPHSAPPKETPQ